MAFRQHSKLNLATKLTHTPDPRSFSGISTGVSIALTQYVPTIRRLLTNVRAPRRGCSVGEKYTSLDSSTIEIDWNQHRWNIGYWIHTDDWVTSHRTQVDRCQERLVERYLQWNHRRISCIWPPFYHHHRRRHWIYSKSNYGFSQVLLYWVGSVVFFTSARSLSIFYSA